MHNIISIANNNKEKHNNSIKIIINFNNTIRNINNGKIMKLTHNLKKKIINNNMFIKELVCCNNISKKTKYNNILDNKIQNNNCLNNYCCSDNKIPNNNCLDNHSCLNNYCCLDNKIPIDNKIPNDNCLDNHCYLDNKNLDNNIVNKTPYVIFFNKVEH